MYVKRWAVRGRLGPDRATCEQVAQVLPTGWIDGQPAEVEAKGRQLAEVAARSRGLDPADWPGTLRWEPIGPAPVDFRHMIQARQAEVGINTYQLGVLSGVDPRTLAHWLAGKSAEMGDKKLAAVLAALGIMGKD